ncbi:hypothetical protein [Hydrogenimonas sp.]
MKNKLVYILFLFIFFHGCAPKVDVDIEKHDKCHFDKYTNIIIYYPNKYKYYENQRLVNKKYQHLPYKDLEYICQAIYNNIIEKYPYLSVSLIDNFTYIVIQEHINKNIPESNKIYIDITGIISSYDVLDNYVKLYESNGYVYAKSYVYSRTKQNILLDISIEGVNTMWFYRKKYLNIFLYLDNKYKFEKSDWLKSFIDIFNTCFDKNVNSNAYKYIDMAYLEYKNAMFDNAKDLYIKACVMKNGFACYNAAELFEMSDKFNKALNYYIKSCEYGYYKGCSKAGDIYSNYTLGEIYPKKAFNLYYKQCKAGFMQGCDSMVFLIEKINKKNINDKYYGINLLKELCDKQKKYCFGLGMLYLSFDKILSLKYIRKACSNGEYMACEYLNQYFMK